MILLKGQYKDGSPYMEVLNRHDALHKWLLIHQKDKDMEQLDYPLGQMVNPETLKFEEI